MRLLFDPAVDPPEADPTVEPARTERRTGIKRLAQGWAVIKSGRLVDEYTGPGCKAAAIRAAGTNQVIT